MSERIQFVNENDEPTGAGTREEAWSNGYFQRLVVVLLKDEEGNVLLQKRSESKKVYPGAWTATASGHVDEGETYEAAAARELKEEAGVETNLTYISKFLTKEIIGVKDVRMFNAVFLGVISHDLRTHVEEGEVTDLTWFTIKELTRQFESSPSMFTPALKETIRIYKSL